jgi:diaminohydroxyphosphoribosylaminopyrimidine deaminase/5-amino-6-(5-phosphoribosylamino)uracil reductase
MNASELQEHNYFMQQCLQIAACGLGEVAPNPMVGALISHNGEIIAQGYHRCWGMPHAEVEAIAKVPSSAKSLLPQCTLYVSLEPCCHQGKTPACTGLIIESGFKRVVAAVQDPFCKVNGGGIQELRQHGIEVIIGVLAEQARELNKRFFTYHIKKRPYIILKWAQTMDGFIDRIRDNAQSPLQISDDHARRLNHLWRTHEQAILIGTNTALADNPMLTARLCWGKNPLRAVVDADNKLPKDLNVFNSDAPSIIMPTRLPQQMLNILYQREIQSVIVEGGAALLQSFIEQDLWDEVRIITSTQRIGNGVSAPNLKKEHARCMLSTAQLTKDMFLTIFRNNQ